NESWRAMLMFTSSCRTSRAGHMPLAGARGRCALASAVADRARGEAGAHARGSDGTPRTVVVVGRTSTLADELEQELVHSLGRVVLDPVGRVGQVDDARVRDETLRRLRHPALEDTVLVAPDDEDGLLDGADARD